MSEPADEVVRYSILNRAAEAMDGIAALLRKVDSNESMEGDECRALAETITASMAEAHEELCAWGIEVQEKRREK